ncbi:tripartite tricarboxylate transporter substrate binding protein [Alcaligenaceae bacterium]|nr:tripartite tricarboxylate transporter substrate binding protein [Alcaligenaceae bacterium]
MRALSIPALLAAGLAIAGLPGGSPAAADSYPEHAVRLIVPYPVGTSNEIFARVFAQKLGEKWNRSIVVEPVPGAGGVVGTKAIASARADGYTLGWVSSPHAINAAVYKELPYDTVNDFLPVVNLASTPMVFVTSADSKLTSMNALLEEARAHPGSLDFGSNGNGSSSHLASALLASMAGVRFSHAPYKSTGQLTTDLASRRIDFAALGLASAAPLVQGGKLRALAVTGAQRSQAMPDVPAVAETVPGYQATAWMGLVVPQGTPRHVLDKLARDAPGIIELPEIQRQMASMGLSGDPLDAAAFARRIEQDIAMWKKVVSEAPDIEQR